MRFSSIREFIPSLYLSLKHGYSLSVFRKDLIAGLTVGIVALPLAMAFAIASGTTPERGLYTAIIAGFLISALGGSKVQIGGPTGAFVVIVYDIIQRTGYEGLCISTLIAAVLLLLMGLFRLGTAIRYIPHPLVTGFTTGIAAMIFSTQIKDFFGLQMGTPPAHFAPKWIAYFKAFASFDPTTLAVASFTLGSILLLRRFAPRIPWGIAAIVLTTLLCQMFDLSVGTIASKFGEIPRSLPLPSLPSLSIPDGRLQEICMDAIAIAFLGAIESLLSAVIGDGMIGGKHRSNSELVGQGIANIGAVLFGGIPATGAIARTAVNAKSGAQTPMAGIIHAATLFLILLFLAPVVSKIPLAGLSAVLIMVSWNMSEIDHFARLLRGPIEDRVVLLTAFGLTVFVDITTAIIGGMILASLLFMRSMSKSSAALPAHGHLADPHIYEIQGPFFFGNAHLLKDLLGNQIPKRCILRMNGVPLIDASGLHALKEFHRECQKRGVALQLSGVDESMKKDLRRFGLEETVKLEST